MQDSRGGWGVGKNGGGGGGWVGGREEGGWGGVRGGGGGGGGGGSIMVTKITLKQHSLLDKSRWCGDICPQITFYSMKNIIHLGNASLLSLSHRAILIRLIIKSLD